MRILIVLLLLVSANGWAGTTGFLSGYALRERIEARNDPEARANALGYITGVADALADGGVICLNKEFTANQLATIVEKYLTEHTNEWHSVASSIVWSALRPTFPCGSTK